MAGTTDELIKATAAGGRIRAVAIRTTDLADEARRRHDMSPTAAAALGKALTGGLLLAATLRKEGRLNVRIFASGQSMPIGGIFVDAGSDGTVRGYVGNASLELPPREDGQLDVGAAVGHEGFLSVTYDLGVSRNYTGTVELVSGELAEDFTAYLANSEQIPSAMMLGLHAGPDGITSASGLLVQLLPNAGDEIAERLEQTLLSMPSLTALQKQGAAPADWLKQALSGFQVEILETKPVRFACGCSRTRVLDALRVLGPDELKDMIATDGRAEARCHFCAEAYEVSREELSALVADIESSASA